MFCKIALYITVLICAIQATLSSYIMVGFMIELIPHDCCMCLIIHVMLQTMQLFQKDLWMWLLESVLMTSMK
jgi:hypothetical protein